MAAWSCSKATVGWSGQQAPLPHLSNVASREVANDGRIHYHDVRVSYWFHHHHRWYWALDVMRIIWRLRGVTDSAVFMELAPSWQQNWVATRSWTTSGWQSKSIHLIISSVSLVGEFAQAVKLRHRWPSHGETTAASTLASETPEGQMEFQGESLDVLHLKVKTPWVLGRVLLSLF